MTSIKHILITILALLLILAGCSSAPEYECLSNSDCSSYEECIQRECVAKDNVCGNNVCESNIGETCETCSRDCKPPGSEYTCENGQWSIKASKSVLHFDKSSSKFDLSVDVELYDKHDIRTKPITLDISVPNIDNDIEKIVITDIDITARINSVDQVLASAAVERTLWQIGDEVAIAIPIRYDLSQDTELSSIKIKFSYEYYDEDGRNPDSFTQTVRTATTLVDPNQDVTCNQALCDDNNQCTTDTCYPGTTICQNTPRSNCCGNFACESGETRATCPQDCGTCDREVNSYLSYQQQGSACVLVITDQQTIVGTKAGRLSQVDVTVKGTFVSPAQVSEDSFTLAITADSANEKVVFPVIISRIQVLDSNSIVGEVYPDAKIIDVGRTVSTTIPIENSPTSALETEISPKVRIFYEYIEEGGDMERESTDISFSEDVILVKAQ